MTSQRVIAEWWEILVYDGKTFARKTPWVSVEQTEAAT